MISRRQRIDNAKARAEETLLDLLRNAERFTADACDSNQHASPLGSWKLRASTRVLCIDLSEEAHVRTGRREVESGLTQS